MNPGDFVLAVDAGGSKTVVAIAPRTQHERGERLERGPANPQVLGFPSSAREIGASADALRERLAIGPGPFAAACLAIAGAGRDDDRRWFQDWAAGYELARRVAVVHDAEPILAAGTDAGTGVALIAGTGSFAFARSGHQSARSGGWGYLMGDEGGGYDLARSALVAVARACDERGPPTEMTGRLCERLGIDEPSALVSVIYDPAMDRRKLAALAPAVFEAADSGDAVAAEIIARGAAELAALAAAAGRRVALDAVGYQLALGGGLFTGQAAYADAVRRQLAQRGYEPARVLVVAEPVDGALRLARGLLSQRAD